MKYQPKNFEDKWVKKWEEEKIYEVNNNVDKDKKQFIFPMFPYPSGAGLHVGHVRIYTGTDVIARFYRMKGYRVLHPIGWDAFGLPAENAAIKAKKNPIDIVPKNIKNFRRQVKMLGFSYDFSREYSTTDTAYYKWTQWLFIQFYKQGLLYKKKMPINYCPKCKTGLADEEVLPDGTHERCGNLITKKELPQWVFKITNYADKLVDDLKDLDWPEGILEMQRNWIGRSEGTEIKFEVYSQSEKKYISVFTTRADTLFGVTALVIAPEHWIVNQILNSKFKMQNSKLLEIKDYIEKAKRKSELARTDLAKEKTGVFTGLYVIHPLTKEKIPLWIADYVIGWYGYGAVMVVPAHDERDFEFAKKYHLPIKKVIVRQKNKKERDYDKALTDYGYLINSKEFNGLSSSEAIKKITEKLEDLGLGKRQLTYKLRDWIFSRQRYWGEPIPMVFCEKCAKNSFFIDKKKIVILIDDSNFFYGKKKFFKVDLSKLIDYLEKEFEVEVDVKYFISIPDKKDSAYKKTINYLEKIKNIKNISIVEKSLKYINSNSGKIVKKENVDVEIAVEVMKKISDYDTFIILSGDSDFVYLRDQVLENNKKILFLSFKHNLSWELKKGKYFYLERIRDYIEYSNKKTPPFKRGLLLKYLYHNLTSLSTDNKSDNWLPIDESQLPLELPYINSYEPTETGESPLSQIPGFVNTTCPNCGGPAERETDTMPNWAGSCWYFLAYCFWNEPKLREIKPSVENWNKYIKPLISKWLPADWYLGGAEHAVLHLLYARFWVKALYEAKLLDFSEPFLRLRNVGMILAEDHRKMSKSFGNVINPDDVVSEFGADALRVYEMFMAPFDSEIAWSTKALQGAYRFVKRVWEMFNKFKIQSSKLKIEEDKKLLVKLNKTIKKVTDDIPKVKFNTAIASMMEFINDFEKSIQISNSKSQVLNLSVENAKKFLKILAPFTPFLTEEIWREVFGEKTSIHLSVWPEIEEEIIDEEVIIPVQVNGKLRDTIKVKKSKIKNQQEIENLALKSEKVKKYLKTDKYKIIYVEGKVVNLVVKGN